MIKLKSEIANYRNLEITVTATMPYWCWKSVYEHLPANSEFTEKLREVMSRLTEVIASETEQWEKKPPVNPAVLKMAPMSQGEAAQLAIAAWGPNARTWDEGAARGFRCEVGTAVGVSRKVHGYGSTWEEACEMAGLIVEEKQ